jgi:predicted phage terminase large subunit-like protein
MKDDENKKSFYVNDQTGMRMATSTNSSVTGEGGNIFIYDDSLNPEKANSTVEREGMITWYKETSYNRLNDQTRDFRVVIEQRLHEDDLTGYLLKHSSNEWRHICIPAQINDKENNASEEVLKYYIDNLFWVSRFPSKELKKLLNILGSYAYAGQYSQRPAPAEGGLFKENYFSIIGIQEYIKIVENGKIKSEINFDLDTAFTKNQANDPTAILCSRKIDNILYILDVKEVWYEMPELIEHCKRDFLLLGYAHKSRIRIEPKASGLSTIQTLRKETNFNVLGDSQTKEEKEFFGGDKTTRANAILPKIESKRVVLVSGIWNNHFLEQLKYFPNGSHDDMVDTLVQACYYDLYKSQGNGAFYMS